MKIIQVSVPTTSHDHQEIIEIYQEVENLIKKHKTHFTIIMGDSNAKIGKKEDTKEIAMGYFGIGDRNERGRMLFDFELKNNLQITNNFFYKKPHRKWTWRGPNNSVKNEIYFILTNKIHIFKNVDILDLIKTASDHRMIRGKVSINTKNKRRKLILKKKSQINNDILAAKKMKEKLIT